MLRALYCRISQVFVHFIFYGQKTSLSSILNYKPNLAFQIESLLSDSKSSIAPNETHKQTAQSEAGCTEFFQNTKMLKKWTNDEKKLSEKAKALKKIRKPLI